MEWKIIAGIVAVLIACFVIGIVIRRRERRQLLEKIRANFGTPATESGQEERFKTIAQYYKSLPAKEGEIDDITWNDLDLQEVFLRMNRSLSSVGEEYLYAALHRPELLNDRLLVLDRRAEYLAAHASEREAMALCLGQMGKLRAISLFEYLNRLEDIRKERNVRHYLFWLGYVVSIVGLIAGNVTFGPLLFGIVIGSIVEYYKRKGEISAYLQVFSYLMVWSENTEHLLATEALRADEFSEAREKLAAIMPELKRFRKGGWLLASTSPTGGFLDMLMDYVRMLFHVDLVRFNLMHRFVLEKQALIRELFSVTGEVEFAYVVSSYRSMLGSFQKPELDAKLTTIHADKMVHPLLTTPVPNSITGARAVLLTGSNASGKSTFLKMLALNAVLAQTIYTVTADCYRAPFFQVCTSMALRDSLSGGESYYIVEIKSLRRILKKQGQAPVLCCVDEVLRGTNTVERIAASTKVLEQMAKCGMFVFAATHDIELAELLQRLFENYHFCEQLQENDIVFDYHLYPGKATSRNAIRLLAKLEYPEQIILEAEAMAARFVETGEWSNA